MRKRNGKDNKERPSVPASFMSSPNYKEVDLLYFVSSSVISHVEGLHD